MKNFPYYRENKQGWQNSIPAQPQPETSASSRVPRALRRSGQGANYWIAGSVRPMTVFIGGHDKASLRRRSTARVPGSSFLAGLPADPSCPDRPLTAPGRQNLGPKNPFFLPGPFFVPVAWDYPGQVRGAGVAPSYRGAHRVRDSYPRAGGETAVSKSGLGIPGRPFSGF